MWKNRLGYLAVIAVLAGMLYASGEPFLLCGILILIGMGIAGGVLVKRDAGNLEIEARMQNGGQEGKENHFVVRVHKKKKILAARYVWINFKFYNEMFDRTEEERMLFRLADREEEYEVASSNRLCGAIKISCEQIWVLDILNLFKVRAGKCRETRSIVYPRKLNLLVGLSRTTVGAPKSEGLMQNRKGNDPSEMFDIREYVPGDDIRSIHWKLSSKTDSLILRQASDPSHYNVVLLPDFGLDVAVYPEAAEINTAIAAMYAVGEQLAMKQVAFCMALPSNDGLEMCQIENKRDLQKAMSLWLSIPIQPKSGAGLQCFLMQHLEQYFTRLLILSAGEYRQNLNGLEKRIGITVIHTSQAAKSVNTSRNNGCDVVEIPTALDSEGSYRIIC